MNNTLKLLGDEHRKRNRDFVPHFLGSGSVTIEIEREVLRAWEYLINGFPDEPWVITLAMPIIRRAHEAEQKTS